LEVLSAAAQLTLSPADKRLEGAQGDSAPLEPQVTAAMPPDAPSSRLAAAFSDCCAPPISTS
jgi:hypothetical protein